MKNSHLSSRHTTQLKGTLSWNWSASLLFLFLLLVVTSCYRDDYEKEKRAREQLEIDLQYEKDRTGKLGSDLTAQRAQLAARERAYQRIQDNYNAITDKLIEVQVQFMELDRLQADINNSESELAAETAFGEGDFGNTLKVEELQRRIKKLVEQSKRALYRNQEELERIEAISAENKRFKSAIKLLKQELAMKNKKLEEANETIVALNVIIKRQEKALNSSATECDLELAKLEQSNSILLSDNNDLRQKQVIVKEEADKTRTQYRELNVLYAQSTQDNELLAAGLENCTIKADSLSILVRQNDIPSDSRVYYVIDTKERLINAGVLEARGRNRYRLNESMVEQKGKQLNFNVTTSLSIPSRLYEIHHDKANLFVKKGSTLSFQNDQIFRRKGRRFLVVSY